MEVNGHGYSANLCNSMTRSISTHSSHTGSDMETKHKWSWNVMKTQFHSSVCSLTNDLSR